MLKSSLIYVENAGRYLMLHRVSKSNDPNKDKWIGVGGKLEDGETPEECARREVAEETGYEVADIVPLGPLVCSPGYCTEVIHAFLATLAPNPGRQHLDADENIDAVLLTRAQVADAIADGSLWDGKTLAAWAKMTVREGRSRA